MTGDLRICRRGSRRASTPRTRFVVTDEELLDLARSFTLSRGRQPTIDELRHIAEWATQARLNAALLPMVLKGLLRLDLDEAGAVIFAPAKEDC
jgi:hypothetical protein